MRAKDIKVGHVYYVQFNPTKKGGFDNHDLAAVLKKNDNEITFIVIPLTGNDKGVGQNKIEISITNLLPPHLQNKKTYAVYDQIRTVNAARFSTLSENGKEFDVVLPEEDVVKLYEKIIENVFPDLGKEEREKIIRNL